MLLLLPTCNLMFTKRTLTQETMKLLDQRSIDFSFRFHSPVSFTRNPLGSGAETQLMHRVQKLFAQIRLKCGFCFDFYLWMEETTLLAHFVSTFHYTQKMDPFAGIHWRGRVHSSMNVHTDSSNIFRVRNSEGEVFTFSSQQSRFPLQRNIIGKDNLWNFD